MQEKILIADDSASIREVLQMHMETLGYGVVLAEDGDGALEQIYQQEPDLVILDVMMPKQNGFQVCRKVKTDPRFGRIPVILLTAKCEREDIYWGKDCGADEYLTKPFHAKELEFRVKKLLTRSTEADVQGDENLETDMTRRLERGEQGGLCILRWDPRALEVFRKKYGEVTYSEILLNLRSECERFVEEETSDGLVDFVESTGFRVLMSGTKDELEDLSEELCKRLSRYAHRAYSPLDRERKSVEVRDYKTGRVQKVPLLSFLPHINHFGS